MEEKELTAKDFGYNPALKEITEQLKEQKEFLMEYLKDNFKIYHEYGTDKVRIEIGENYDAIASYIAEIVAIEFKENVFYRESKKS